MECRDPIRVINKEVNVKQLSLVGPLQFPEWQWLTFTKESQKSGTDLLFIATLWSRYYYYHDLLNKENGIGKTSDAWSHTCQVREELKPKSCLTPENLFFSSHAILCCYRYAAELHGWEAIRFRMVDPASLPLTIPRNNSNQNILLFLSTVKKQGMYLL